MNACAGDNSCAKMIPMFAKVLHIRTVQVTGLLNRVVCNMETDINTKQINCVVEDHCICWTTLQNLDLWIDSWGKFVVKFGFATINNDRSLHFTKKIKARIINMDETCLSLDGSNSN